MSTCMSIVLLEQPQIEEKEKKYTNRGKINNRSVPEEDHHTFRTSSPPHELDRNSSL